MRWTVIVGGLAAIAASAHAQPAQDPGPADNVAPSPDLLHLKLGFTGGYQLQPILVGDTWQDRTAFSVLRPSLRGSIYQPWITFLTSVELADNPPYLLDAYVNFARWKQLQIEIGQFQTPFSRAETFTHREVLFVDQSVVANYFATGRDKGVAAYGELGDRLQYWLGAFGGSPLRQFTTVSGNYVFEGRVTASTIPNMAKTEYPYIVGRGNAPAPFGLSASLEGYVEKIEPATEDFDPSSFELVATPTGTTSKTRAVGADVFAQGPNFAVFTEAYFRGNAPEGGTSYRSWGIWGQAAYLLVPETLDVAVRLSFVNPSLALRDDTFEAAEAQLGWYIDGPHLVAKLRYGLAKQHSPGAETLGDVTLPVGAVGTINIFTAQLSLWF